LKSQPHWRTIILVAPDGQQIVNLLRPLGAPLPQVTDRESVEEVVRTGTPTIGSLVAAPVLGGVGFAIRVPVLRDGAVKYVLSAGLLPEGIGDVLAKQELPRDWVAGVLDRRQTIVARSRDAERTVGKPASETLRAAVAKSPSGWFHGVTLDG